MSAKANKDFELPLGDVGRDTAHGKTAGQRDIRQEYAPFEKILRVFRYRVHGPCGDPQCNRKEGAAEKGSPRVKGRKES